MVLDFCCIIIAAITSIFNETRMSKIIQKRIVERYLDLQDSLSDLQNDPYNLLTNKSAAQKALKLNSDN